ncbi:MAG: hypothetical protein ACPL5F_01350 [Moorellaceae bacterium]
MAEVTIQINASLEAAKQQVEELRRQLADLAKGVQPQAMQLPPAISHSLTQYMQQVRQLSDQVRQLQAEVARLAGGLTQGAAGGIQGIGSIFSRIKAAFIPSAPASIQPASVVSSSRASLLLFDTPDQVAQFLRSAGFTFTGRETRTLADISARLLEGKPITERSLSALSQIVEKFEAQAEVIAEDLRQARKFYQEVGYTESGRELIKDIDRKFASLDTVAEYFRTLEEDARKAVLARQAGATGEPPAGGGRGGFSWLSTIWGGIRSALGPLAVMTGVGALGYGTHEYMQTMGTLGEFGALTGAFGRYSAEDIRRIMQQAGERAGYFTPAQFAQGLSTYRLFGAYIGPFEQLVRAGETAIGPFARAFGLDLTQAAQVFGVARQLGGFQPGQEERFADAIAAAIQRSGIDPRQFLQANQMLVQAVARQVGNVDVTQLANLQATLDRLGVQYGLTAITGTRGAEMLVQLNQGITAPGGGAFGEFTVLQALRQAVPGLSLPQALLLQRKGLGELAKQPEQFLGFLQNIWQRALRMGGGDETYAELFMQDILHLQPGQIEALRQATGGFRRLPTPAEIEKITGGQYKSLQEMVTEIEKAGGLAIPKVIDKLTITALDIGSITFKAVEPLSEFMAAHPYATGLGGTLMGVLGIGGIAKLFGNIFKGGDPGAGALGEILPEAGGWLSRILRIGGKWLGPLGSAGVGIWDILRGDRSKAETWGQGVGEAGGGIIGGILGFMAGGPVGGLVGSFLGQIVGRWGGEKVGEEIDKSNVLKKIEEGISKLNEKMFSGPYSSIPGLNPIMPMAYTMTTSQAGYMLAGVSFALRYAGILSQQTSYRRATFSTGGGPVTAGEKPSWMPESDWVLVKQVAAQYGIDPYLLAAIGWHETHWGQSGWGRYGYTLGVGAYSEDYADPKYKGLYAQLMEGARIISRYIKGSATPEQLRQLAYEGWRPEDPESWAGSVGRIYTQLRKELGQRNIALQSDDGTLSDYEFRVVIVPKSKSPAYAPGVAHA